MDRNQQRVEIVCVQGIEVLARVNLLPGVDVDAALADLNRTASPGQRWQRPITYREPLESVCQGCGVKHGCRCPRTRAELRAERGR